MNVIKEIIISLIILLICSSVYAIEDIKFKYINIGKLKNENLISYRCKEKEDMNWFYVYSVHSDLGYVWCVLRNRNSISFDEFKEK